MAKNRKAAPRPQKSKPKKRRAQAKPPGGTAVPAGGRDAATGEFRAGNRFWQARRTSVGPESLFADGEALWAACDAYFCWAEDNPIVEEQLVTFKGMTRMVPVPKMRPMTKRGLCRFLGIAHTTWAEWKKDRPELAAAIEWAESVLWDQKFGGALVGIFNGNLVARELGIADRLAGHDGGAVKVEDVTPKHPGKDHLEDMADRFLGGLVKHNPEAAERARAADEAARQGGRTKRAERR